MRGIKYRAWDKTSKNMIADYAHIGPYGELYVTQFHSSAYGRACPDLVLMQFTGLTDKNGAEIYEGDILKSAYTNLHYEVIFNGRYEGKAIGNTMALHDLYKISIQCYEVVGNVYTNPEMLEV